jgi:hypothetical protein
MEAASISNGTPGRFYFVASTDAALEIAIEEILDHSLAIGKPLQIEVVDMRH